MKLTFLKIIIAVFPFLFFADNTNWKVKKSSITFKIKNAGITIDGSFTGLKTNINFNPLKPEEANIFASVESKSVNTENDMRDDHLRKIDYFSVEKFPLITLQSTKVTKTGPISFSGVFNLTIKGVTKEIIIPFNFIKIPEKTELKGNFTINRLDFKIGTKSMTLADNAKVILDVEVE